MPQGLTQRFAAREFARPQRPSGATPSVAGAQTAEAGARRRNAPATPLRTPIATAAGALLAAGLLAGCATDGVRPSAATQASEPAAHGEGRHGNAPGALPGGIADAVLIGAPAERVLATLGEPELQRRESPAEIWQYRGETGGSECVLDVFLYTTGEAQTAAVPTASSMAAGVAASPAATPVALGQRDGFAGFKQVVHMEARDGSARSTAVAPCLDGVVSTRYAS